MGTTYEDKRAELKALASGGTAGRDAYKEGRQRLVSDQRAAIDAALSGPVRFGADTASALESIVRPVGDTAMARMDFAGEQHGSSMGALDAALSGALAQQGGARTLNYNRTLSDARTQTDRSIEAGEIQRRKAAERAAAAEAERAARAAAAGAGQASSYSQGEEKMAAEALGGLLHEEDVTALRAAQEKALSDELVELGREAFAGLSPEQISGLTRRMVMVRDDPAAPAAIAALIAEHSPAYAEEAQGALARGVTAIRNIGRTIGGLPEVEARPRPAADPARLAALTNMLGDYQSTVPTYAQDLRALEAERYLYNQNAYASLFGDPLLAAGIFPQSFDPVAESLEAQSTIDQYVTSGLTGKDYELAIDEEMAGFQTQIASAAGITPGVVNGIVGKSDLDAVGVYETLSDPEVAAVVSLAVETAMERYEEEPVTGAKRPSKSEITRDIVLDVTEALPDYVDSEYRQALAAIAREQFSYLYGG